MNNITTYTIFYKKVKIGVLEINEYENLYRYIPDYEGINIIKNQVSLINEMVEPSDWREPIPFFANRINNAKKFGKEGCITSHTDLYKFVKN